MDINENLLNDINKLPDDIKPVAKMIFKSITRDKPTSRIQDEILEEIREIVYQEEV